MQKYRKLVACLLRERNESNQLELRNVIRDHKTMTNFYWTFMDKWDDVRGELIFEEILQLEIDYSSRDMKNSNIIILLMIESIDGMDGIDYINKNYKSLSGEECKLYLTEIATSYEAFICEDIMVRNMIEKAYDDGKIVFFK